MDFLKKTAQVLSSTSVGMALDLVTSILIVQSLGATNYGVYTIAFLIPSFMVSLSSLGLASSLIYHLNKGKMPLGGLAFFSLVYAGIIGGGCYLLWYFFHDILDTIYLRNKVPYEVLQISMLYIPIILIRNNLSALLRATYRIKEYTLIVHLLPTTTRLPFVFVILYLLDMGLSGMLWIPIINETIVCLAVVGVMRKELYVGLWEKFVLPQKDQVKRLLAFGSQSHLGGVLQKSNDQIVMLTLTWLLDPSSVGYFGLASKLTKVLPAVTASVTTVLVPKVARSNFDEIKSYFPRLARMLLVVLIFLGGVLGAILPLFVEVAYGNEFRDVTLLSWILLPGMAMLAIVRLTNAMFTQTGHPMIKSMVRGTGLIVNVLLLVFLLPIFGLVGGAVALTGSYIVMFVIAVTLAKRRLDLSISTLIFVKPSDIRNAANALRYAFLSFTKPTLAN